MLNQNGPGMAGEDASLDGAVAAIAAKLRAGAEERPDTRENRADRDVHEREQPGDLEELERLDAEERAAAETQDGKAPAEVEGKDGEEAEAADDAQYIELPAAEDGAEPERVPLTEAIDAVKQLRQMQGEIATAVIRAEEEAFSKQDQITQALSTTFETVRDQAKLALQMMHAYAPQAPDPIMLDRNSGYYDPEAYHTAKIHYDAFVDHYNKVKGTLTQSENGLKAVGGQQDSELVRRETERTARFIPAFKDEKSREAKKSEYLETLKGFGIEKADLDEIADHRAWRMIDKLHGLLKAETKAPEVRKHLQEKTPKIVNGRAPQSRDTATGQYISKADQAFKKSGSVDDFARLLMSRGDTKNL